MSEFRPLGPCFTHFAKAEERAAEATELDEMLAEQESMEASSRLDDDSNLVSYQSPASEWRSEQTNCRTDRLPHACNEDDDSKCGEKCDSNSRWV